MLLLHENTGRCFRFPQRGKSKLSGIRETDAYYEPLREDENK